MDGTCKREREREREREVRERNFLSFHSTLMGFL
jgi:hypothetical protein